MTFEPSTYESSIRDWIATLRGLGNAEVLSLYLPLTDAPALDRGYIARAKTLLHSLENDQRSASDIERVLAYIVEMKPTGRMVAAFSCAQKDYFEAVHLQVTLPAVASFGEGAYLAPIESAFDNYPLIATVVIGERDARILLSDLAEVTGKVEVSDDVSSRQRQGGWAAFRIERDRAEHVRGHFRHVAHSLTELHATAAFRRLVLAGSPESASGLIEELPGDLRELVAGTAAIGAYETDAAVITEALAVAARAERDAEVALVSEIRERAFGGGKAALGWQETMQTLRDGRVHRLALAETRLASAEAEEAARLAWDSGAELEVLRGEAETLLDDNGGIGALLRY